MEAQRLGLKALSGDLNPVAVLIQKAMIEIPPRFAGLQPVHPELRSGGPTTWERAQGLAADVEVYGRWMRDEAHKRIGHLYPEATGPNGEKLTPIAWIWARTVQSPDPAWTGYVPLVKSWILANRTGKPLIWVDPIADHSAKTLQYKLYNQAEPIQAPTVGRGGGRCVATGAAMPFSYIRSEFLAERRGQDLMAIAAEGPTGRVYCRAKEADLEASRVQAPNSTIGGEIFSWPGCTNVRVYGMNSWSDLFTERQLLALTTFSDLLASLHEAVESRALAAGLAADGTRLRDGGSGSTAYADAVTTYLAFVVDRCADYWSTLCTWTPTRETIGHTFARQALPMTWDFAEANPFSSSTGNWMSMVSWVCRALARVPASRKGDVVQSDARTRVAGCGRVVVSTDPPYYDNVPYSYIADFFYVWMRRHLSDIWPAEMATISTPKNNELIANQHAIGSKEKAADRFESGMVEFMREVSRTSTSEAPSTIFYAYKATESSDGEVRATGWDTFLQGVVDAGMQVTATWPVRTEMANRVHGVKRNMLASSIVLACRPRLEDASVTSRPGFVEALRSELPEAIRRLQSGNIAPVDMAQSAIGPGISIFSRYSEVLYADGSAMPVSDALAIINEVLGEILDGEASELDEDTRFALDWYAQHGFEAAGSGDADNLARAKNTSLAGIERAGIGEARAGKFRLYRRDELPEGWDPERDERLTAWEAAQHLVATLEQSETHAAELLYRLGAEGDSARQLAYLLYAKADANGWAEEAFAYNMLISAWSDLRSMGSTAVGQGALL